jgi:hypothetical protein
MSSRKSDSFRVDPSGSPDASNMCIVVWGVDAPLPFWCNRSILRQTRAEPKTEDRDFELFSFSYSFIDFQFKTKEFSYFF